MKKIHLLKLKPYTKEEIKSIKEQIKENKIIFSDKIDNIFNKENNIKYLAYQGNKDAIEKYVIQLIDNFLKKYNTAKNKDNFLNNELTKIEENVLKFANKSGNNFLYQILGDFYSKIGYFKDALSDYITYIELTGDYKGYEKIAQLYKKFKKNNLNEIKKIYEKLYKISFANNDIPTRIKALEELGDINKKLNDSNFKNFYIEILSNIINNTDQQSLETMVRLLRKMNLIDLIITLPDQEYYLNLENIYILLSDKDKKYFITLGNFYEENNLLLDALLEYLSAIKYNVNDSKDALLMFLETKVKPKLSKTEELDEIIEKIKKKIELSFEDKIKLLSFTMEPNYVQNIDKQYLKNILQVYKKKLENYNYILYLILKEKLKIIETENDSKLQNLMKKIKNYKSLNKTDISTIFFIVF